MKKLSCIIAFVLLWTPKIGWTQCGMTPMAPMPPMGCRSLVPQCKCNENGKCWWEFVCEGWPGLKPFGGAPAQTGGYLGASPMLNVYDQMRQGQEANLKNQLVQQQIQREKQESELRALQIRIQLLELNRLRETGQPAPVTVLRSIPATSVAPGAAPLSPSGLWTEYQKLNESYRRQLDKILLQMLSKNEPYTNVQAVIDDIKQNHTSPAIGKVYLDDNGNPITQNSTVNAWHSECDEDTMKISPWRDKYSCEGFVEKKAPVGKSPGCVLRAISTMSNEEFGKCFPPGSTISAEDWEILVSKVPTSK